MPLYREDTVERWCATEVDAEGVMVAVSLKLFLVLNQESKCPSIHPFLTLQGKWGYCKPSCYEDQLLDGSEYCGVHSSCVNNDDDTRGLTCQCGDGFTAHRPNFGEWGMQRFDFLTNLLMEVGREGPCLGKQRSFGITSDTQAAET